MPFSHFYVLLAYIEQKNTTHYIISLFSDLSVTDFKKTLSAGILSNQEQLTPYAVLVDFTVTVENVGDLIPPRIDGLPNYDINIVMSRNSHCAGRPFRGVVNSPPDVTKLQTGKIGLKAVQAPHSALIHLDVVMHGCSLSK